MLRVLLFITAFLLLAVSFGCNSTSSAANSEVTTSGTPVRRPPTNVNANANPVSVTQPMSNANGVPANLANTVVPGLDPKNAVRTIKPGEKIPGIPDQETIRRQMNTPVDANKLPPEFRRALNSNTANIMPSNANAASPMMRKAPTNTNASPSMMKKKPTE